MSSIPSALNVHDPAEAARRAQALRQVRENTLVRIREVDAARRAENPGRPLHVVALVQHLDTWGALAPIVHALKAHTEVVVDVVTLDSPTSRSRGETAHVVKAGGDKPQPEAWLRAHLDDIDVVLLCDGYDAFRPEGLRVPDFAERGIRMVYSPYGTNTGGAPDQLQRQYNGLLHNLAWRVFAGSAQQRALFDTYCAAGAEHVYDLGSVKRERVNELTDTDGQALRRKTRADVNVLWNPHFTVGPDGWSTFFTFVDPMLDYARRHPDVGLIIRPHFRLFPDLRQSPAFAHHERDVRRAVEKTRNIALDTSRDYLPAFAVADALVSDQSSLIPEFLPRRKPVCYLTRPVVPALNADAAWMSALPHASAWPPLEAFLDAVRTGTATLPAAVPVEAFGDADRGAAVRIAAAIVDGVVTERAG